MTTTFRERKHSEHEWTAKNKSTITRSHKNGHQDNEMAGKSRIFWVCKLCGNLPMLHPFGAFRCSWDAIIMLMLIYTSLEVPFTLGFGIDVELSGNYQTFGIIALLIDVFLLCDICFNFRTAYFDKYDDLRLITNSKRIAYRYVKGWFIIDLMTSFPFEFLLTSNGEDQSSQNDHHFTTYLKILRIFRLLRIVKILRLLKMVKLFDGFVSHIIAREVLMVIRLFKILCFSLLSAHFCACFWYYVGCKAHSVYGESWIDAHGMHASECGIGPHGENSSLVVRYSFSWYWSVVTLFTTGYGDVIATNPYEQWAASAVILIGTCLFGCFVGTMTSLITEGDRVKSTIVNKLEDAQHFCQQKKLPPKMSRAVLTHTRYHCNHNYVLGDENDVLSNLPSYLAMDVSLYISDKYLENLDFFANKFIDPYIRGLMAMKMKSISCNKGYKLFVKGDIAEKIYIQRVGTASHTIYDKTNSNTYKQKTKRGNVVGEYAFILKKRDSTLICQTWCEFYVLDVNDILEILQQHYGQNWLKKLNKIKRFIKLEYSKPIQQRKKRHCLIKNNPLLPSFKDRMGHDDDDDDDDGEQNIYNDKYNTIYCDDADEEEEEGQQGHCDWGNQEEIKEAKDLQHLETITGEVLKGNGTNDIKLSLNALSKHAYQITKLSNTSNKSFIQCRITNPLASASSSTLSKTKNVLKRLIRDDSFTRNLEVTNGYNTNYSSDDDSKYDDDYDNKKQRVEEETDQNDNDAGFVKKKGKTNTLDVADDIDDIDDIIEMMGKDKYDDANDRKEVDDVDDNKKNNDDDYEQKMNKHGDDGNDDDQDENVNDDEDDESNNTDSLTMSDDVESRNTDSFSETDTINHKQKKQKKGKGKKRNGKKRKKKMKNHKAQL